MSIDDDNIPQAHATPAKKSGLSGASVVWLVPLVALGVALWVGVTTYADKGPLIRVAFEDASSILPKETELRFRNVPVGVVEKVAFNDDLTAVHVDIRVDNSVAPFIDDEAEFWVVQPEVSASGVTGLSTVLSGVYIAGNWDNVPGGVADTFTGRKNAPLATADRTGVMIGLRSMRSGGLSPNRPIVFKGIEVGRIGTVEIEPGGTSVRAEAIIYEPHDKLVSSATRFWDTSGFRFSLGPNGAELDFSSLASLVAGGITFDTIVSGGTPLEAGMDFEVFPDQATARAAIFEGNDGEVVTLSMIFEENVTGLASGSLVEWRGLGIGQVASVTGIVDEERFGDTRVRLLATVDIRPTRFGLGRQTTTEQAIAFLEEQVARGVRARLASASLLTSGLKIELVDDPTPNDEVLDRTGDPYPIFPVTASNIAESGVTVEGVLQRVASLPVEDLLDSAISFLDGATALVANQSLQDTPAELLGLVVDARGVVGSDSVQALPEDLRVLVEDLRSATGDLRGILAEVRDAGAVERVLIAVDQAGLAAASVDNALAGIPALTERITTLVDTANALPLDELVAEANGLAAEARAFVASEALKALPETVTASVNELSALLTSLNEADTAGTLATTLREAGEAAQAVEVAVAGLPDLTSRITTFVEGANELPLDEFVTQATGLAAETRTLVASDALRALPTSVGAAVAELTALLTSLTEAQTAEALNTALTEAGTAAQSVQDAVAGIPGIVERLDRIAANAENVALDELAAELESVLGTASRLLGDASDANLPTALAGALTEAEAALAELRAGGLVESANATMASAQGAARAIETAANDLPALVSRLAATLSQAQTTLADFDGDSPFNRQTTQALREIERAAKAVTDLAKTINRRPNSILLGR